MGLLQTADVNLTNALDQVTSYFTSNINPVITAVVGIAVFLWILKLALRSFGIVGIHYDSETGGTLIHDAKDPHEGFDLFWD